MVRAVPAGGGRDRVGVGYASSMSEGDKPDPLARLGEGIERARARSAAPQGVGRSDPASQRSLALGVRIGMEFLVAIVVATGLGWAIDRWVGTRPWGMIVLFFLGVGAGMVNVYRAILGTSTAVGYHQPGSDGKGRSSEP